jgi:hypothetical protein
VNHKLKRALAGMVATAIVGVTPLLSAMPASAATLAGPATVKTAGGVADLSSGDANDSWTLRLPAGAACAADGNNGGRWHTYMMPGSQDPATDLAFNANGSLVGASTGTGGTGTFKNSLYTTAGLPVRGQAPNLGDAAVINIPNMDYMVWTAGQVPSGVYNVGIACVDLDLASAIDSFWNQQITVTYPGGDAAGAQISWSVGAVPAAPVLGSLTPGDGTLEAAFTPVASTPATTGFTVSATPSAGGATITATGASSPITVPGLTNGTPYDVMVHATNSAGDSAESNILQGTPNPGARPAVTNLQATPGTGKVDLTWTAPTGPAPTGYLVEVSPAAAGPFTTTNTFQEVTGLTAGTLYTFTVTPQHPAPYVGTSATAQATPFDSQVLQQEITVVRPVGALVLTQVCGANGDLAAEVASAAYPFDLPGVPASSPASHTAPELNSLGSGVQDPEFGDYPYPVDANNEPTTVSYPTHCGVNLGRAKFVTGGTHGGKFFAASGVLNQVTVVDTRDTDIGWTINGTMGTFSAGPGKQFSGSQLGWTPVKTSDTEAFTDSDGITYDQVVTAGGPVAPNSPNASGLGSGRELGGAAAGEGLGIGVLDARLKLLIPVTAKSGTYTGVLSITSI